jgi:translation initiation factor 5A
MSDQEHHSDHETFEGADAGAALSYPLACGSVKKNSYMVFQGRPCKVVDYSTSKTGKHGHAKANIVGIDIFNGKKYEDSLPTSHNVEVPNIKRTEWTAITYDAEGYLTLMDLQGNTRQDLKLPDNTEEDNKLSERIKQCLDDGKEITVTVLESMKIEKVVDMSDKTNK